MDDETFATESEPWVTVHNNRRRRNIILAGILLVVGSITALVLGVTLYDKAGSGTPNKSAEGEPAPPFSTPTLAPTSTPTASPTFAPTEQSLYQFLQQESLHDGSELDDTSSYQYQAYVWLEGSDHSSLSDERILQRFALACIFFATNQIRTLYTDAVYGYANELPEWNATDNWLSDENECTWFGILCDSDGKVADIELYSNSLTGSFPPEVIYLKESLVTLDLFDNVLWNQGDVGHYWIEELVNLEYLFYGNTFFQYDGIPTYIGALTNLVEYDCSTTLYFGELQGEIFTNLERLEYLAMGDNSYNLVELPSEIINLPNLEYLFVHNCDLQGTLEFLPTMTNMKEFWIDKNPGIAGSIPTAVGQMAQLESFSATECALTGRLPTELGNVSTLRKLWLSRNQLTGIIPPHLGNITELELLEVYDNNIVGRVPTKLCRLVVPSAVGGNLTSLVVDCELNCTCCTSCQ